MCLNDSKEALDNLLVGTAPRLGKGEVLGGSLTGDHGSLVTAGGAADAPAGVPQGSNCCCGGCVCCCTGIPQGSTLDEAAAIKIKFSFIFFQMFFSNSEENVKVNYSQFK